MSINLTPLVQVLIDRIYITYFFTVPNLICLAEGLFLSKA